VTKRTVHSPETLRDYPELKDSRRKLTDEQITEICELREKGKSEKWLADKFKVSPAAIHWQCLSNGAVSPRQKKSRCLAMDKQQTYERNGRQVRGFTPEEDEQITALALEGKTPYRIHKITGRAYSSVRVRLMSLGIREDMAD